MGMLTEGCFVVVASDGVTQDDIKTPILIQPTAMAEFNRVGIRRPDKDGANGSTKAWELVLDTTCRSSEENLPLRKIPTRQDHHAARLYRSRYFKRRPRRRLPSAAASPTSMDASNPLPTLTFSGFAQDIAVYTTFCPSGNERHASSTFHPQSSNFGPRRLCVCKSPIENRDSTELVEVQSKIPSRLHPRRADDLHRHGGHSHGWHSSDFQADHRHRGHGPANRRVCPLQPLGAGHFSR
jgi:hypothetical protein